MHRLLPDPSSVIDLDAAYSHPDGLVRANMVASLDGAVRDGDGRSGGLSSPADKRVFGALRGACDVVLVGAGTVRAEGYGPARPNAERQRVRLVRGQAAVPVIAVVSTSLELDLGSPFFTEAQGRPIVVTVTSAPPERRAAVAAVADVVQAGEDSVDVRAAIEQLRQRGLTRVLCEGGPHLLTDLASAGVLDELCLTIALTVVGGDSGRLISGAAIEGWHGELVHLLSEVDHLFLRVARSTAPRG